MKSCPCGCGRQLRWTDARAANIPALVLARLPYVHRLVLWIEQLGPYAAEVARNFEEHGISYAMRVLRVVHGDRSSEAQQALPPLSAALRGFARQTGCAATSSGSTPTGGFGTSALVSPWLILEHQGGGPASSGVDRLGSQPFRRLRLPRFSSPLISQSRLPSSTRGWRAAACPRGALGFGRRAPEEVQSFCGRARRHRAGDVGVRTGRAGCG